MKLRIHAILFALFIGVLVYAQTNPSDVSFYYNYNGEGMTLVSVQGTIYGALEIPDSVSYAAGIYPVTAIGAYAFKNQSEITSVVVPNTVLSIGDEAFSYCTQMNSVVLGNSVSTIGYRSFYQCYGLTEMSFPESLTTIGQNAFGQDAELVWIKIPAATTTIADYAFQNCSKLSKVYLKCTTPPSIGYNTFAGSWIAHFYVPCDLVSTYKSAPFWKNRASDIYEYSFLEWEYTVSVNNEEWGVVNSISPYADCDSDIYINVSPYPHFRVVGINDRLIDTTLFVVHLTSDTIINIVFGKERYVVVGEPNVLERGIVMGSDTVEYQDTVILTATANYGYHFTQWNDGNTQNPRSLIATQNTSFTALFVPNSYRITLSVDSTIRGRVTGAGSFQYLSERTIMATSKYGYHFVQWSDGDTLNPRSILLTQDTSVTAQFAPNIYNLTVLGDSVRGWIDGESGDFEYMTEHTYLAVP